MSPGRLSLQIILGRGFTHAEITTSANLILCLCVELLDPDFYDTVECPLRTDSTLTAIQA